jgi:hypothetical protein
VTYARTNPERLNRHERRGFLAFPLLLLAVGFFVPAVSLPLAVAACAGWAVFYWAMLNHRQNPVAAVIFWAIVTFGGAVIVIYLPTVLYNMLIKGVVA